MRLNPNTITPYTTPYVLKISQIFPGLTLLQKYIMGVLPFQLNRDKFHAKI